MEDEKNFVFTHCVDVKECATPETDADLDSTKASIGDEATASCDYGATAAGKLLIIKRIFVKLMANNLELATSDGVQQ